MPCAAGFASPAHSSAAPQAILLGLSSLQDVLAARRVCRGWRSVLDGSQQWPAVQELLLGSSDAAKALRLAAQKCSGLRTLDVRASGTVLAEQLACDFPELQVRVLKSCRQYLCAKVHDPLCCRS